jgi:hypothetical protein
VSITILYPTNGANVPGNGGFLAWGVKHNSVVVTGASLWWPGQGTMITGTPVTPPAPCDWAFRFQHVPVGLNNVTLTVQGMAVVAGPGLFTPVPVHTSCSINILGPAPMPLPPGPTPMFATAAREGVTPAAKGKRNGKVGSVAAVAGNGAKKS